MKIERFEDIEAWQEAIVLVNLVYGFVLHKQHNKLYELNKQVVLNKIQ
jgi:hypothetical protein